MAFSSAQGWPRLRVREAGAYSWRLHGPRSQDESTSVLENIGRRFAEPIPALYMCQRRLRVGMAASWRHRRNYSITNGECCGHVCKNTGDFDVCNEISRILPGVFEQLHPDDMLS